MVNASKKTFNFSNNNSSEILDQKNYPFCWSLPEFLNGRLFLPRDDNIPRVVDWEEQNVPVAAEPRDEEGAWERLEGQLNHLSGTDPGGGHAQHHQQSPQHLHSGAGTCLIGVALPARLTSRGLRVGFRAFLSW